jgi:hypothetical protein
MMCFEKRKGLRPQTQTKRRPFCLSLAHAPQVRFITNVNKGRTTNTFGDTLGNHEGTYTGWVESVHRHTHKHIHKHEAHRASQAIRFVWISDLHIDRSSFMSRHTFLFFSFPRNTTRVLLDRKQESQ